MHCKKIILLTVFLSLIFGSVLFPVSDDFVLHKKIKIIDEKGEIAGIHYLVFDPNGNIYILLYYHVYKINEKGKCLGEIIRKGEGPNEIVLSFSINMNESVDALIIHDHEKQKITLFDLNGKYLQTMDVPTSNLSYKLTSNNIGDYYLSLEAKKGECQLLHLDKDFKPLRCFSPYNGITKRILGDSIKIDIDLKGNIYTTDTWVYKIQVFKRTGDLINSFASPGKDYKKLEGNAPSESKAYFKWRHSASAIHSIRVIEDKALIVLYGDIKRGSDIYYDLYSLDGKKASSGIWEKDIRPVGKDRQGRLVCVKEDVSADGTEVAYWLYIYSINDKKLKL